MQVFRFLYPNLNINQSFGVPWHFSDYINVFVEVQLTFWANNARKQKVNILLSPEDGPSIL